MWKWGLVAAVAAAGLVPSLGSAGTFDEGMDTLWEVLWHQSGTATRLVRWEQDVRVRVHGVDADTHRPQMLKALQDVAAEAGVKLIDVTDRADAAQLANVDVEITPDAALTDDQPCETRLNFDTETTITSATLRMRSADAARCAYHEAMHVMGVRGHPEGDTVLSYFGAKVDGLQPLDRAMLRAWYAPGTRAGMTPFEVLPILADQLVAISPDRAAAALARDRFIAKTVGEMEAFAEGQGDVPAIVRRSGKSSEVGVRFGRMEMSYFLGVAYQQGAAVKADPAQATRWLQRASGLGSRSAQAQLATSVLAGSR